LTRFSAGLLEVALCGAFPNIHAYACKNCFFRASLLFLFFSLSSSPSLFLSLLLPLIDAPRRSIDPIPETAFLDAFLNRLPIGFANASNATNAHLREALGMSPLASAVKRSVYSVHAQKRENKQKVTVSNQNKSLNLCMYTEREREKKPVLPSPSVCELLPVVAAKYKKSPRDSIASSLSFQNCGPNTSLTVSETDSDTSCVLSRDV